MFLISLLIDDRHGLFQAVKFRMWIATGIQHVYLETLALQISGQGPGQHAYAVGKKHTRALLLQRRSIHSESRLDTHARGEGAPRHIDSTAHGFQKEHWNKAQ